MKTGVLISFIFFFSFVTHAQGYGRDYEGYYHLRSSKENNFSQFWYFNLQSVNSDGSFDTSHCFAKWFLTDSSLAGGESVDSEMQFVHIWADSISFGTKLCYGEQYSFNGKLLFPATQFPENRLKPVIEGVLILHKYARLVSKAKATFSYDLPGD